MATNFFELATTLEYLGAKWLPGIKVNFTPWLMHLTVCVLYYPTAMNTVQITMQIYNDICTVENLFAVFVQ